jgi:hypothetical protein
MVAIGQKLVFDQMEAPVWEIMSGSLYPIALLTCHTTHIDGISVIQTKKN